MDLVIYAVVILIFTIFSSCQMSETADEYIKELMELKKITLPIDDNSYYLSKSIFQFEEDGQEYLFFGNTNKGKYGIIIYNINSQDIFKRIPLSKEGPNGIRSIFGCKPFNGSKSFMYFQHNISKLSISDDQGKILYHFSMRTEDDRFIANYGGNSYFFTPSFIKDSVVYVRQEPKWTNNKMRRESVMFSSLNLKTGEIEESSLYYPLIFNTNVVNPAGGYGFSHDYNYKQNRLVCSFTGYDSLMVSDDLQTIRWYNGKSRFLRKMRPTIEESSGVEGMIKRKERPKYSHIMYDKYRDVYYRFAEMPCELGPGEYPLDEPKAREFSVIVFDKDFNIIGETKFPGSKYFYKMSFVGRDGLYISENNLANPDFDENKLVFACFKLEDVKGNDK